ncbi:MAG: MFS transporter [Planctomycetota bacterium]
MNRHSRRSPRHDPYAAFRIPAYRRLIAGALLVSTMTAAQGLAIGWEMYQRTDEPLALGLVGLVQAIPMLLFTLPAGYLADVFDRRWLIVLSLLGATLTSVALAGLSYWQGPTWLMYALLFADATALRMGGPARSALMPLIVPSEVFENAVKWRTSLSQISAMVGPAVGGFVLAWWLPGAYLFSALGSTLFVLLMLTIRLPQAARTARGNMLPQVGEGLRFVWRQKLLLGTTSLDLFAVLLGGAVYLLPVYVQDIIDVTAVGLTPEQALGWLRAAPAAGAMVMALLLAHRPPIRRAGRSMLLAVAGFGAVTIVFGLSRNFWLSLAMLFLTGVFDNVSVVVRHTLVMLVTPNAMRGRVSAVNSVFIGSSNELGGFESGLVAQWFGPVASVVSGGIGTILVVATWAKLFPRLRRFGSLADAEPGKLAPTPAAEAETIQTHGARETT